METFGKTGGVVCQFSRELKSENRGKKRTIGFGPVSRSDAVGADRAAAHLWWSPLFHHIPKVLYPGEMW